MVVQVGSLLQLAWFCCRALYLTRRQAHARHLLGSKLYERGLGEAAITIRVHEIETRLASGDSQIPARALKIEQKLLLMRLAAESIESGESFPGLDMEQALVISTEKALSDAKRGLSATRTRFAANRASWARVMVGYTCLAAAIILPLWSIEGAISPSDSAVAGIDDDLSHSVGLVIVGAKCRLRDGRRCEVPVGQGSCFVVAADGSVFTNLHVVKRYLDLKDDRVGAMRLRAQGVEAIPTIWVFFGKGGKYEAEVVYRSSDHDFAILKIEGAGLRPFKLASSTSVGRSVAVYACGFPEAGQTFLSEREVLDVVRRSNQLATRVEDVFRRRDFEVVVTSGTVSRVAVEDNGQTWLQHTAALNPGNSGGPLITPDGRVLGINTQGRQASGMFFALDLWQLKKDVEKYAGNVRWK